MPKPLCKFDKGAHIRVCVLAVPALVFADSETPTERRPMERRPAAGENFENLLVFPGRKHQLKPCFGAQKLLFQP